MRILISNQNKYTESEEYKAKMREARLYENLGRMLVWIMFLSFIGMCIGIIRLIIIAFVFFTQ